MIKLRPIQEECLESVISSFKKGGTYHLVQAPVAFGKTILASALIQKAVNTWGAKCLFLAHLQELVLQTEEKLKAVAPEIDCGIFGAGLGRKEIKTVTIGTKQSIVRALDRLGDINLIIIDEVHVMGKNDDYLKIINHCLAQNPRLRVLGVTGTPFRLGEGYIYGDDKRWNDLVHYTTLDQMIEIGYLSPYRYKMACSPDLSKVKKSAGEFNISDLGDEMIKEYHMGSVKQAIEEHAQARKSIMVFAVTIEHAEALAEFLGCEAVHSKLNRDTWRERVDRFKSGEQRILVNVTQLSIGFDAPIIDCIVLARPTMSPALFVQMIGRGLRLSDKEDCLVLDLVGNYKRHGLPSNPRVKKPEDKKAEKKEQTEREANVCPECFEIVESSEVCEYCGAELVQKKIINEIRLEEIKREESSYHIKKMWYKTDYTTKRGYKGTLFCIKLEGYPDTLFKFCSSGSINEEIELRRSTANSQCILEVVKYIVVDTGFGKWVEYSKDSLFKYNLREQVMKLHKAGYKNIPSIDGKSSGVQTLARA